MAVNPKSLENLKSFQKGKSGNPGGKTSKQKKAEIKAAERRAQAANDSAEIRALMTAEILKKMKEKPEVIEKYVNQTVLMMLRDAEDRHLGKASQKLDIESPDGSMTPTRITRRIVDPDG